MEIAAIEEHSPAADTDLAVGDEVLDIGGVPINALSDRELTVETSSTTGTPITLRVRHSSSLEPMIVRLFQRQPGS